MTNDSQHRTTQQSSSWNCPAENRQNTLPDLVFPANAIADPADGTLNKDVLQDDLVVDMPVWANLPPDPEEAECELMWAPAGAVTPPPEGDFNVVDHEDVFHDTDFPLPLTIPKAEFAVDGKYFVAVRVTGFNGIIDWTTPKPLICDRVPPYDRATPVKLEAPADAITDDYLAANADKVILKLPQ